MGEKIFRDPLYNYVGIDTKRDRWLLELLDCPEVQRLRRIHQLGVSYLTYPGADHNRLVHSLGVLHLMQRALKHIERDHDDEQVHRARGPLLAAALLHDVGHGPFSHLFEPCLGTHHEEWSIRILTSGETSIARILRKVDSTLPQSIANLIDSENNEHPTWVKYLLSSQLDMDRLDYLRRDSLFTGAGYGHYDWQRILTTFELADGENGRDLVWSEKSKLAIEEYIFARHYMYQNVYLHKTTRGFEKMLEAMWARARDIHRDGGDASLLPAIRSFWDANPPTVLQYLGIEEFTVMQQIQNWCDHPDRSLADLARRFLGRGRLCVVEPPSFEGELSPNYSEWEAALRKLVESAGYEPQMYCLRDQVKAKYNQPYFPERESDEQSIKNAIRIRIDGEPRPIEISQLLDRLGPFTQRPLDRYRYYVPHEVRDQARRLRLDWNKRAE